MNITKSVGRAEDCDHVILDPQKRVSRKHCVVTSNSNGLFIEDNSSNGTFVNGKRIPKGEKVRLNHSDRVMLSGSYPLNVAQIMGLDNESTRILNRQDNDKADDGDHTFIFENAGRKVEFNADKTTFGDLADLDKTSFKTIGRDKANVICINDSMVSRDHCKIRLLFPQIIEVIDLDSTNGTFADENKLLPNKPYRFDTNVVLRLGKNYKFNIRQHFPEAVIVPRAQPKQTPPQQPPPNTEISQAERKRFMELKTLWEEYQERQSKAGNVLNGYSIGGAAIGIVAAALTGGGAALLMASGGGLLGRYLGQQKSNEIRQDLTYEDMFLQTYACPRCQESFQKRPWITLRECFKCKIKFR